MCGRIGGWFGNYVTIIMDRLFEVAWSHKLSNSKASKQEGNK
jgi:hypothetical protein